MMNQLEISLVVSYYNRVHTLTRCLDSIATRPMLPLCIIMVDNASTDQSHALVDGYIARCTTPTIRWQHITEPQRGAAAARNAGLACVQTPWVCFFDSDDELSPAFLYDALRAAQAQPCDLVLASTTMRWPDGKQRVRPLPKPLTLSRHIAHSIINTQCFVARTAWLRQGHTWHAALPVWNDYELGTRLLLAKPRIAYLAAPYHTLHQHADSLTGKDQDTPMEAYLAALQCVAQSIATLPTHEQAHARYALLLKASHWRGLQRLRGRTASDFVAYDAWCNTQLATCTAWQRACCAFVCWGTQRGWRGLLRLAYCVA